MRSGIARECLQELRCRPLGGRTPSDVEMHNSMAEWAAMTDVRKKPCCICRKWLRPDPRIGQRQRACNNPLCQKARHDRAQASRCARNPDCFIARRIQLRQAAGRPPGQLRLPRPLPEFSCDIAQDEFWAQRADFLGVMGTLILAAAQDEIRAYLIDFTSDAGPLPLAPEITTYWRRAKISAFREARARAWMQGRKTA